VTCHFAGYDEEDEEEELQEHEVDELEGAQHEYEARSRSPPRTRSPRGAAAAAVAPASVARSGYSPAVVAQQQQRGHYAANHAAAVPATVAEALAGGKLAFAESHSADIAALRKARVALFGASNSDLHGVVLGRTATAAQASVYLNTSAPYALLAVGSEEQDVHSSAHTVLAEFVTTSSAAAEDETEAGDAPHSTAAALVLHYSASAHSSACSSAAAAADAVTVAAAASEPEAGNSGSSSSSAAGVTEVVVLLAPRSAGSRSAVYEGLQHTRALPLLFEWSELSTEALCALLQAGASSASASAADSVAAVVAPLQRKTDLQALQVCDQPMSYLFFEFSLYDSLHACVDRYST
jgi:hypothetical protein